MKQIKFGDVSCTTRIKGIYHSLNTAERALADYILANEAGVINSTIKQVAAQSGVSYSTVCRFCARLGLGGFKELREKLTTDMLARPRESVDIADFELLRDHSTEAICEKTFQLFGSVLDDCAQLLELPTLDQAVQTILRSGTLHIIGAGASAASAMYAHTRLLRLGIPCVYSYDPVIFMMNAALMKPQDVLLAISSSGRTASIVDAARRAQQQGARVISISDYCNSPLQSCSHINLYTTARTVSSGMEVDLPLTIGQIAIIDILYSCCITSMGDQGKGNYLSTKQIVDTLRLK